MSVTKSLVTKFIFVTNVLSINPISVMKSLVIKLTSEIKSLVTRFIFVTNVLSINPMSVAKSDVIKLAFPATVVTLLLIPATLVISLEIEAQVVTFEEIPLTTVKVLVAVVPSWMFASKAMSVVTAANVVTSSLVALGSITPVVELNCRNLPFLAATSSENWKNALLICAPSLSKMFVRLKRKDLSTSS